MSQESIGIMVQPLKDRSRLLPFAEVAQKAGFALVYLLYPTCIHFNEQEVDGYLFKERRWQEERFPFPSIIYDIGIYRNQRDYRYARFMQKSNIPFVSYTLGSKGRIDHILRKSPFLATYLIPTHPLKKIDDIWRALSSYQSIILKPVYGWGGRGIFKIENKESGFAFYENQKKQIVSNRSYAKRKIRQLVGKQKYIIQPWLDIRSLEGNIADHRLLIQKDGQGEWRVRIIGTRIAPLNNITSNMKSGAKAIETHAYLNTEFGARKGKELYQQLIELACFIAPYLESSYGKRLVELGIDFAIDRRAAIKLIEVNIKPGRQIVKRLANQELRMEVLESPFLYARSLLHAD